MGQQAASRVAEELAAREAEIEEREAKVDCEFEQKSQWAKQLEEKERRHIEACQEAQALRSVHRVTPSGPGKENNDIMKQLEEQQDRMHNIKQLGWKQNRPET